jgi:hypothetical protein
MNLRDFAFTKDADALDHTDIEVDGTTFRVLTPTLETSSRIESAVGEVYEDENGDKQVRFNTAELQVTCLIELCVDPETSANLFNAMDREAILNAKKGSRLARLAEKVAEVFFSAGKSSESTSSSTQNSDSSADSQKTSDSPSES